MKRKVRGGEVRQYVNPDTATWRESNGSAYAIDRNAGEESLW
jgi:hypothetical protein